MYGQSFSLADANENGLNAKTYGPGQAGEFTRAGGFLAYYEVSALYKWALWFFNNSLVYNLCVYVYKLKTIFLLWYSGLSCGGSKLLLNSSNHLQNDNSEDHNQYLYCCENHKFQ